MPDIIAVAVDGTPAGQSAIALAGNIAAPLRARVSILCTIDAGYALQTEGGAISPTDRIEYPAPAREQLAAEGIVDGALRAMHVLGVDAEASILVGNPAIEIVAAATRMNSRMIVMGHRHLSWIDRMLHPSVCWDVLERATCPVLVSMVDDQIGT